MQKANNSAIYVSAGYCSVTFQKQTGRQTGGRRLSRSPLFLIDITFLPLQPVNGVRVLKKEKEKHWRAPPENIDANVEATSSSVWAGANGYTTVIRGWN
jgi:hypothetical protein